MKYNNIFLIIISIYSIILLRLLYIGFKKYNNDLVGSDKVHVVEDYKGFFIANYTFNKKIGEDFYSMLCSKILDFMKKYPKDTIFLKVSHQSDHYEYRDLSTEDKRKELLLKLVSRNKINEKWGKWDIYDTPLKFYLYDNKLSILGSHAYLDGFILMKKYFLKFICIDTKELDIKLPTFYYYPIITEMSLIKSSYNITILKSHNLHLNKWNERKSSRSIIGEISQSYLKELNINNNKYSIFLSSLYIKILFQSLKKNSDYLNICFIIALNNKTNFNNFGLISFDIKKSNDLKNIVEQVKKKIKSNRDMVYSSYLYTSILNFTNNMYKKVDCVFSFLPVSKGDLIYKDYKVIDCSLQIPYTSAPVYLFSSSFSGKEHYTINLNSNDIDRSKLISLLKEVSVNNKVKLSKDYIKNN